MGRPRARPLSAYVAWYEAFRADMAARGGEDYADAVMANVDWFTARFGEPKTSHEYAFLELHGQASEISARRARRHSDAE